MPAAFAKAFDEGGCGLYWRDGVFLSEPTFGGEALVQIDGRERPILRLSVAGSQPGWFLAQLYPILVDLLAFWPGLNKTFKVGCPTQNADGRFCDGDEDFEFLVAEEKEAPESTRSCRKCRKPYRPREWLFGFAGVAQTDTHIIQMHQSLSLAREQAPCPRAFTLMPVDRSWYNPRKFLPEKLAGKVLRLTLHSEHSLEPVIFKDFTVEAAWIKWIGPMARIGSLLLTGLAVPLTGPIEAEIGEATRFMGSLGGVADKDIRGMRGEREPHERIAWPSGADLRNLEQLLKDIGLAPHYGGMEFVRIRGKGYFWVTKAEADAHGEVPPQLN